jgi:integrase
MSDAQLRLFLDAATQYSRRTGAYFMTLALAGLRPGEGLGLQWTDLDFTAQGLRIERAISHGEVRCPKTYERRTVGLHPTLAATLRRLQAERKAEALRRGASWDDRGYVFATESGGLLDLANVENAFKRILKEAGLPTSFVPYDLRHTFATSLLAEGAPITYVSVQLGHATPATTLRFYAHWLPRPDRRYVDRLLATRGAGDPEPAQHVTDLSIISDLSK